MNFLGDGYERKKLVGYSVMCIGFVGMGLFVSSESASAAEWYNPNMNVKKAICMG